MSKIKTTFDGDIVWLFIDQITELIQRDKVLSEGILETF